MATRRVQRYCELYSAERTWRDMMEGGDMHPRRSTNGRRRQAAAAPLTEHASETMVSIPNSFALPPLDNRLNPPTIGPRLKHLRKERGWTLDELAAASGVSRSMLSQIERGQANPTLAIVWHLSQALGVELSEFVGSQRVERRSRIELTTSSFVPEIRTEDGRCVMRILSPASEVGRTELYHLTMAPAGELISDAHARGSYEHLSVLSGELLVESGDTSVSVGAGSIARYPVDLPHAIRNRTTEPVQALLVVVSAD